MKAIVLAGGYATRLRPLTLTRPKPLLPVLDKPLIFWILNSLLKSGIREAILSVKYMSHQIKEAVGDGDSLGMHIVYIEENQPMGDAGPLKLIDKEIGLDETFLVIYGDVFTDIDINAVVSFHKSKGATATLTAVPVDNPERYGIIFLNEEDRVVNFIEKPSYRPQSNLANAGVYVFEPEVLKYIEDGKKQKISINLIPKLLALGNVFAYVHKGLWFDIGVPEDYLRANLVALNVFYPKGYVDDSSDIHGEILGPVYIGRNTHIGKNSVIGPSTVLLDSVVVGERSLIKGSLVMRGSKIGSSTYIRDSIVGEECSIGNWVRIESGVIIGDQVSIADEVFVNRRNCVLPYKEVSESLWEENNIIL